MAFASLVVAINADIQSLDKGLKTALSRVQAFGSSLTSVGSALAIGVSAPLAAFAGAALQAGGEIQSLKLALDSITRSSEETSKQFARLRELAKLPGLGLAEVAKGSVQIQSIGQSAQTAERWIKAFGNAIAAVGGGKSEFAGAVVQLQQMSNKSKVLAEDLKPLLNNIPQIGRIMRENFGAASSEELGKMGVSAKQFLEVVVTELEKIPQVGGGIKNSFENLSDSVKISLAQAGDALAPFATKFIDDFATPALAKLSDLAKGFQSLQPQTQSFLVATAGVATVGPIVITAIGSLISNLALLTGAWQRAGGAAGIFSGVLAAATSRFTLYGAAAASILPSVISLLQADQAHQRAVGEGVAIAEQLRQKLIKLRVEGVEELTAAYRKNLDQDAYLNGLRELALKAAPKVAQEFPKATAAVKQHGEAVQLATQKVHPFLEVLAAQGVAGEIFAAKLQILQGEHHKLAQSIAQSTLNLERGKSGWLDFTEALGLGENVFFKTKVGIDSMEGAIDSFVKRAAQAGPEVKLAFDSFKAEADLTKFENQQRGRSGVATTKRLFLDKDALKDQGREFSAFSRQVSLVSNDLARDLAKLAFSGGKFAETMTKAFKSFGESLVRLALEKQIGRLVNMVLDFASKVRGLDKVIGAVFGGGVSAASSAAGSAAGAAGSAAGSIAGAGSSAAGAAASGTLGIVGAVAGVATAVSSIIGNFQFAGMNKSLDIIVKHTLETSLQLQSLQASANQWWPKLGMIHDRLAQIIASGVGVFNAPGDQGLRIAGAVAGGGGGNTFNFYITNPDPRAVTDEINRYLRQRGL